MHACCISHTSFAYMDCFLPLRYSTFSTLLINISLFNDYIPLVWILEGIKFEKKNSLVWGEKKSSFSLTRVQFGKKIGLVWEKRESSLENLYSSLGKQGVQFGKFLLQFGKTGGLVLEIFYLVWEICYLVCLDWVYLVWDY